MLGCQNELETGAFPGPAASRESGRGALASFGAGTAVATTYPSTAQEAK
jgi:hypothetical protein